MSTQPSKPSHAKATPRPCTLTPYQLGNAIMRALSHERIDSDLTAMDCEVMATRMLEAVNAHDAAVALAEAVRIAGSGGNVSLADLDELACAFETARKGEV